MYRNTLPTVALLALLSACASQPSNTGASSGSGSVATGNPGPAAGSEEDLMANVGDRVFFPYNDNSLTEDARATLDKQSSWLGSYPQDAVQVAGNCDERGTEEYNIALGERRANSARDYLVAHGIASTRITTISYGKDRPTALGSDDQSYAQNRNAITSIQ